VSITEQQQVLNLIKQVAELKAQVTDLSERLVVVERKREILTLPDKKAAVS
jgi:hypothetical protein